MRVCHAQPTLVLRAVCRKRKPPNVRGPWSCRGRGGHVSVSGDTQTSVPLSFRASNLAPGESSVFLYLLSVHRPYLSLPRLLSNRQELSSFLIISLINVAYCHAPPSVLPVTSPCACYDCCCWRRPSSGKGANFVGAVPTASGFLHKPAVCWGVFCGAALFFNHW